MRNTLTTLSFLILCSINAGAVLSNEDDILFYAQKTDWKRGSVHDPSITYVTENGQKNYYVFGSHMGGAKTTDLKNWTNVLEENENNQFFCDVNGNICSFANAYTTNKVTSVTNYAGQTVNWGNFDIPAYQGVFENFTVRGNQWAPDMIYNPTMKKWCYYMSLNGNKWNSAIVLFTSDNIEGPFQYQGPIIFSGFNVTTNAATDYTKTDMQIALGNQSSLPARYNVGDKWGEYWPHAIDPGVFYDDNGELWMNYGSWSGGIYVIKLDKKTGLRDYTYTYSSDYSQLERSVTSDPYFGKKIAGGYYVSGEGSYIEKIGNYYYLFMSYGFYSPEGGYEMRIFRSQNPDGPYTDHTGESAIYQRYLMNYGTKAATNRGMKLMGGYQWEDMSVAEIAQGHNSALMDEDGNAMVFYHTKFNDGTAGHQLRVHQLFVNQDGWITAAPHEYNRNNDIATTTTVATKQFLNTNDIAGTYNFVLHKYKVDYENYEYTKPVQVTLNANGSVSGSYTGTWALTEGTSYITLKLNNVTYRGVVVPGTLDATNLPVVAITAMSTSNGVNIWASKLTDEGYIAKDFSNITVKNGDNVYHNLPLTNGTTKNGCTISWESSDSDIIAEDGTFTAPEADKDIDLTVTIKKGDYTFTTTLGVTAKAGGFKDADIATGLVAYYNFDKNLVNQYATAQVATVGAQNSGTKPTFDTDSERGTVLHQYFGYDAASSISYTTITNPLNGQNLSGATVSAWVKRLNDDAWDALWSFCDGTFGNVNSRLYLTGNTYMGYNDGNGTWFDYNHPGTATVNTIPVNEWALVTFTFDGSGFNLYIDGKKVADETIYSAYGSSGQIDYNAVLKHLSNSTNIYLGYGSFWGSSPALFDDLLVWNRALGETDIARLYLAETTGGSLLPGEITASDTARLVKHGAGSSNQTLKVDSVLVEFYFNWENASTVQVTGLPNGITATIDNNTKAVTFKGTANDEPGVYEYTIKTIGGIINTEVIRAITIEGDGTTTGVDNVATQEIQIYPNPSDGEVTIAGLSGKSALSIYNAMGQKIYQQQVEGNSATIGIDLPSGSYIVEILTAEQVARQHLLVK